MSASSRRPPALPPRAGGSNPSLRASSHTSLEAPPPYSSMTPDSQMASGDLWASNDPRSSSTQSLTPTDSNSQRSRRKLLLIYIHGFMGNETSFRSFPAHVHNLLTVLVASTHVVHTKVYPRYRSRRNISFARDDFSKWLQPHENDNTDVVLLGHSMGGLLSAEVALMPAPAPANRAFKHRILGTINFDVPFLGMHPRVVKSGLASIFRSSDEPGDQWTPDASETSSIISATTTNTTSSSLAPPPARNDTFWNPPNPDPNFNPSFTNDVVLPVRQGWRNALHFVSKHSRNLNELTKATKQLVSSHLEFGGAMANYSELRARYARIRALEEGEEERRKKDLGGVTGGGEARVPRVRFVNYYTVSSGHVKRRLGSPRGGESRDSLAPSSVVQEGGRRRSENGVLRPSSLRSQSPRISVEEHSDDGYIVSKEPSMPPSPTTHESGERDQEVDSFTLTPMEPIPLSPTITEDTTSILSPASTLSTTSSIPINLPPLPDLPTPPSAPDTSSIHDPDTRKLVEKEHARALKTYEKAVKDREKAVKEREKLEARRARKAARQRQEAERDGDGKEGKEELTQAQREELRLAQEKLRMEAEARRLRGEPEPEPEPPQPPQPPPASASNHEHEQRPPPSRTASPAPSPSPSPSPSPPGSRSRSHSRSPPFNNEDEAEQKATHKFCSLPPANAAGEIDKTWIRVFMRGVDEVGAHCGLFFVDERYERLVGDVAGRVEGWVREVGDELVAGMGAEDVD